jgi:predicted ABC-type ATPase
MKRARDSGYQVGLIFVVLADVELNVKRIAERVSRGGHDIPPDIVRRRYPKSFANLANAIKIVHGCLIYDNSYAGIELLLRVNSGAIDINNLDESQTHHTLIADALAEVLGVASDVVFRTSRNS